ncbi:polysaccharide deacetylase family protein [Nocardiopsis sp. JB363]|uniref:polysaccharide deacetylase family protein n=1 Tax=Nocardiopsis sp. JB363 TaxID=1434837 RepID=UPI00097A372A|nr:polysaccharide deacetylase family protein [Nocardiopsis sp. JB363]SIO90944.1 Peptidoglycan N-acetylglucosamine deacetylase [Nocardiopsis sp. JB363]
MVDTSLRRKVTVCSALGLLLLPGCQAADTAEPYAEAIGFISADLPELHTRTVSVETDDSTVGYRYPVLGESHPLSIQVRTAMAERQTAFLEEAPEGRNPELRQDTELLAASADVIGLRLNVVDSTAQGPESSTLWYDAEGGLTLAWTSLFRDEQALVQAHVDLADVLREEYELTTEELPAPLGEVTAYAEALAQEQQTQETEDQEGEGRDTKEQSAPTGSSDGPDAAEDNASDSDRSDKDDEGDEGDEDERAALPPGEADLTDPEQSQEVAHAWADSPLADLAFSTAGGLAVRMDPDQVPGAKGDDELLVPIEAEAAEENLSELGYQARDAAVHGNASPESLDLGPEAGTEGTTLDCAQAKCVALTFDDGPGEHTEALLDSLDDYQAKATFYVLGSLVGEFPDVVERTAAEGHEVANHTWKHDDLATMSDEAIRKDLQRTDDAIEEVTGQAPVTMRPPYGSLNATVRSATAHPLILWDVDTMDWQSRDTKAVSKHALKGTQAGSVVLFHDIHKSSVDAIPDVLAGLHKEGYHFVTVKDLFGLDGMEAGEVVTDARLN